MIKEPIDVKTNQAKIGIHTRGLGKEVGIGPINRFQMGTRDFFSKPPCPGEDRKTTEKGREKEARWVLGQHLSTMSLY